MKSFDPGLLLGFFTHSFNFSTCDWPAHISHFFLFQSPRVGQNGHHQNSLQTVHAGEGAERRKCSNTAGGNVNGATAREGLKKTKNRVTIRSYNLTPEHVSAEKRDSKGYMDPDIHCSFVYNNHYREVT